MRVINVSSVISETLGRGPVEQIEFIQHSYCAVYRVKVDGEGFIVHLDRRGGDYLKRLRRNLGQVAELADGMIPQVVAWANHGDSAVLICREIPGSELSRANVTAETLDALAGVLFRLHSLPVLTDDSRSAAPTIDDPAAFPGFVEQFLARISDLPIRTTRVRRQLDQMADYLQDHADDFRVTPRLIHGDLHRSNIVVAGSRVGLLDWADLAPGDYAYDLATLKFVLDSVVPKQSAEFMRTRARAYRDRFSDSTLEVRLKYFLALAGLVRAFHCAADNVSLRAGRAWRVRACYLHSEAQWQLPLRLDGAAIGGPAVHHEDWAVDLRQPLRGIFYLLAPKRVP
jgi:Ser/Thr protein kinase RdoA (MazF antagonist)